MQENIKQVLQDWKSWNMESLSMRGRAVWKCIPFAICWVLWKERNERIFEDKSVVEWKIPNMVLSYLFHWMSPLVLFRELKFSDWMLEWDSVCFTFAP